MSTRIEWIYTDERGAVQSLVLADDAAGLPIVAQGSPSFGVAVQPVAHSRAEARSLVSGKNAGLDGDFTVSREFASNAELEVWLDTHWAVFIEKGILRKTTDGRARQAPAMIHAGKPKLRKGVSVEVTYFYATEGIFKEG